ncbi:MAG: class I SAM-dependent methyltransferase [Armatimonadota bacterium]
MTHEPHRIREYYDHENVYRKIREQGYTGWDPPDELEKLNHITEFLTSKHAPSLGSALDLGCGGGEIAILLAQHGWKVVGIDYSETAIEMAHENAQGLNLPVEFIVGDATKVLPVDPKSFSLVLDNGVLHCLTNYADRIAFLKNAYNALDVNGTIFSVNMTSEGYLNYLKYHVDSMTLVDTYNTRYWISLSELTQEFWDAGFKIKKLSLLQELPDDDCGATATIIAMT